ncbi:hypothetical protein LXH13_06405 [Streptomyces spinosirectus]|jgi:hypothetical protein|uniref:hypothetical protein n=1 Tax=Streptomyces TaxID=1883 RepID=UPI001C9DFE20|nr:MULTISPECIES: hypothetical protein [Streptomyces]MBY8341963.1 hypothetical protein [Streptomyces plumbidurans]UIR16688.1 hypothetical protein LXH13_06405 [Streptomyces spinosirectus]
MTTPSFLRRWRTRLSDAQANRLRTQLAEERDRNRSLEQRVADLQDANLGAYHELSIANGNACLKANCTLCKAAEKARTA